MAVKAGRPGRVPSRGTRRVRPWASGGQGRTESFYRSYRHAIYTIVSIIGGLAIWEFAAHHTSRLVMAPLESIWSSFTKLAGSGVLGHDVAVTLEAFAIGVVIASAGGIVIGLVMATNRVVFDLLDPWVSALRSTPLITVAPLFIVAFGLTITAKIAVVILLAIFPVIVNTADGIRTADRALIEGAYAFGAKRWQVFTRILIPSALPFIISGIRLAISLGLVGEVVAEFFGAQAGLGFMVFQAAQTFDTGTVFLGVFIMAAIGIILTKAMYRLERWIAPWREFDVSATRQG